MKNKERIIITILAILGACIPFGSAVMFLEPTPSDFELPTTVRILSAIGIAALVIFTGWLISFVVATLWKKQGD